MPILEMKVPSPGESISEVEIAAWLVSDGDYVEKDQAIAEVDSDKATLELPAEAAGVITLKSEEGDVVPVGGVVPNRWSGPLAVLWVATVTTAMTASSRKCWSLVPAWVATGGTSRTTGS